MSCLHTFLQHLQCSSCRTSQVNINVHVEKNKDIVSTGTMGGVKGKESGREKMVSGRWRISINHSFSLKHSKY